MTKAQERARARRRYEKRQAAFAQRDAERSRNKRVAAVVVTVLAVVAAFVVVAGTLNNRTTPAAGTTPTKGATTTVAGCAQPPAPLGTAAELNLPDKKSVEGKAYTAVVTTNCGDITFALDGAKAPQTVASFDLLASKDFWRDAPCHRLTTAGIYVLQCGDPTGTGSGGPGYGFGVENAPADNLYPRGTLAMARTSDAKKGNGSQFFIVYKDTTLPGGYTIFGTVTGGMDIVDRIAAAGVTGGGTDGNPAAPISILRVAVTEKKG